MARDEYIFSELAKYEVREPGITLTSPENAELVQRLQEHWSKRGVDVSRKRTSKYDIENRPVILMNAYGNEFRYKSVREVAKKLGYEDVKSVIRCIKNGVKLRGNFYGTYEDGE